VLNGVGGVSIIAPMIGKFVGTKADVRAYQGTTSPESGCMPESIIIFF